jgi:hypothetical protein
MLDSTSSTPWTFGTLNGNSQLYSTLYDSTDDEDVTCKLFYGGTSTVDFFYPSINNDSDLTLYEKTSTTPAPTVDSIAITNPPAKTTYTAGGNIRYGGLAGHRILLRPIERGCDRLLGEPKRRPVGIRYRDHRYL